MRNEGYRLRFREIGMEVAMLNIEERRERKREALTVRAGKKFDSATTRAYCTLMVTRKCDGRNE